MADRTAEELRPGIWSIRQPITGAALVKYTLSHLIEDSGGGLHVIDPGWDSLDNWELLSSQARALGRSESEIASVTVTHLHADHLGLAGRVRAHTGAVVFIHAQEQRALDDDDDPWEPARFERRLAEWGVTGVSPGLDDAGIDAPGARHQVQSRRARR